MMALLRKDCYENNKYKVSILVPCYKVEKYLPRCLDSLMNQSLENIEVICINDGSPDNCIEILERYEEKYPQAVVIIDKENEGVWRARRDGVAIARGEYIGFVDGDDYVAPDYCEKLYQCAKENDSDISVCGFKRVDSNSEKILSTEMSEPRSSFDIETDYPRLLELNGAPWNKFFRSSLLKNIPDLVCPPIILEDMMMHLLVFLQANTISFVPESLVFYTVREDSAMTTFDKEKSDSAYAAMLEVKELFVREGASQHLVELLDAAAFLHFGISLMFRASCDKSYDLKETLAFNKEYLDANFPTWNTDAVISKKNAEKYGKTLRKIFFARQIYRRHLMKPALSCYRFLITEMHIEIKW